MHSKDTKRRRVLLGLMVFLVTIFIISFVGDGSLLCDIFRGFFP